MSFAVTQKQEPSTLANTEVTTDTKLSTTTSFKAIDNLTASSAASILPTVLTATSVAPTAIATEIATATTTTTHSTTLTKTTTPTAVVTVTSVLGCTYATAQNWLSNLWQLEATQQFKQQLQQERLHQVQNQEQHQEQEQEQQQQQQQQQQQLQLAEQQLKQELQSCSSGYFAKSTLMRGSTQDDVLTVTANKLNTIEESYESNNSTQTVNNSVLSLNIQNKELSATDEPTTTIATTISNTVPANSSELSQVLEYPVNSNSTPANTGNNSSTTISLATTEAGSGSGSASATGSTVTSTTVIASTYSSEQTVSPVISTTATVVSSATQRTPSPSDFNNSSKVKLNKTPSYTKLSSSLGVSSGRVEEDTISKSSDTSGELVRGNSAQESSSLSIEKSKSGSRLSERAKKKSWYNVLYPNYKSRSQDFKKLFKEVPNDERLIVDYSCALQRDILVQGRLYVSQNYVCFHANIFGWETYLSINWKDVTSITKEKTALVIPNAISICTNKEKYFFATFTTRDKAFLMLFRVWQNTLMNKQMLPQEMWQWVHICYGDELGLTTDDEDYIDPTTTSIPNETESDIDFVTAVDDSSASSLLVAASDLGTITSNNINININQSINQSGNKKNISNNSSSSSSAGSSSGGGGLSKSKSKSYFFNSNKSKNSSSTTPSASGSDNKASDNNSADSNNKNPMKPNAKELTLTSVKPEENTEAPATSIKNASTNGSAKESKGTTITFDTKRKIVKISRRDESLSKNSEPLPTDVSASSDSDEKNIPFVATTECNSPHEGRQILHTILPINVETLFNMLFTKSKFLVDFHANRKTTDTLFGEWITHDDGIKTRIVNVTVQLSASVGPKTSKVTEYQTMRDCSKAGELYSIDINSENAGIPYADSFSVLLHYCLVKTVDDHTMLSVHAQIKYKKSIWTVVKGFIEKNTWAGLEEFYSALLHSLQSETCVPPAKGKGRRPRRGTATQVRPMEETMPVQQKAEPVDNMLATQVLAQQLPTNKHYPVQQPTSRYRWISIFVILFMSFLILLNVILLLKLWKLEERIDDDLNSRARMPNLAELKELPNTPQDWIELLRQQEILHEAELKKWYKVLQTAIDLLKKVSIVCQTITNDVKLTQQIIELNDEL
ncbi:protein Aster-B-like isoform X2 [Teleopsis dalmanni]|uniref:protein Aster-B-like isoform X2 n=1 Tax=Teleopsis dalmanni TaxID=139649 RepID=UPI0018CEBCA4|nr:protein Aster-B-like isoform X2 [Teleopsis dalmanni]